MSWQEGKTMYNSQIHRNTDACTQMSEGKSPLKTEYNWNPELFALGTLLTKLCVLHEHRNTSFLNAKYLTKYLAENFCHLLHQLKIFLTHFPQLFTVDGFWQECGEGLTYLKGFIHHALTSAYMAQIGLDVFWMGDYIGVGGWTWEEGEVSVIAGPFVKFPMNQ